MSGHCHGCGTYHEEDTATLCGRCNEKRLHSPEVIADAIVTACIQKRWSPDACRVAIAHAIIEAGEKVAAKFAAFADDEGNPLVLTERYTKPGTGMYGMVVMTQAAAEAAKEKK